VPVATIRSMVGGTRFKSFLTDTLAFSNGIYTLKGRGYGHGVGMSQWGAYMMGHKGKTYKEILQFYFPGTKITLH
jgi:SpoIID/LytB domain protein